jgi:hypothetical protein
LVATPNTVALAASRAGGQDAIGVVQLSVTGGSVGSLQAAVSYPSGQPAAWLRTELTGLQLALRASPTGLQVGGYNATVSITSATTSARAQVEVFFTVTP